MRSTIIVARVFKTNFLKLLFENSQLLLTFIFYSSTEKIAHKNDIIRTFYNNNTKRRKAVNILQSKKYIFFFCHCIYHLKSFGENYDLLRKRLCAMTNIIRIAE